MKHQKLREAVLEANLEVVRRGLVLYTFGNASGIDRSAAIVAIKPSGVPYEEMRPADIVLVDLEGAIIEGALRPSSDLPTHLEIYRAFPSIGGIVHTHSRAATSWAQAGRAIPCYGTTHADYFHGPVPVTGVLTQEEIDAGYEVSTGRLIIKTLSSLDPLHHSAVLVAGHAPFCWGKTPAEAAHIAVVLEEIAAMALNALTINPQAEPLPRRIHDKHFFRKHGPGAYYGQK